MANILGLALKVTGDASGLAKSLTPVDRALDNLSKQADRATAVFKPLTEASAGAAKAQEQFAERFANLAKQLQADVIGPKEYAAAFGQLTEEAQKAAAAFERGIEITERYVTVEERRAIQLREIADLQEQGALTEQTAARARADITGETQRAAEAAAAASRKLADAIAEGARLNEQYATAEEKTAAALERTKQLRDADAITLDTYNRRVADLTGETERLAEAERELAQAFAEGARIQKQYGDQSKNVADEIARLVELEKLGAIDATALNNAAIEKLGLDRQAAESAKARADAVAEAERRQAEAFADARRIEEQAAAQANRERAALEAQAEAIRQRNLTAQERFDQEIAAAAALERQGLLSKEDFNRELQRQADLFAKATVAANGTAKAVGDANLKFNELSGVLAAIPGPIGNFAGRLSGLASAGEGLGRVFSGGLSAGLSSIGTSLASVVNPATLAAAGIAGIGAAAAAVVSGLSTLEAETERLQNAADKLGVSFGFIQTLEQAANMSGVSFDTVNSSMTRLLKTLAGADEESKAATAALGRLGVSLDDLNGRSSEEQLRLIGERLQAIEDPAKRAAAATAIFGKSGAELLPFFQNLGIAEQTLTRFNARLAEIDVARVLALGDSFDAVKASLSGVSNELLTPFIGITQSLSDGLASAIAMFGRNIGAVLDIFSPLTSAVGAAGNLFLQFGATLGNLIGTVLEPFAAAGRLLSAAIDAISQTITGVAGRVNDAIIGFREFFKFEGLASSFRDTFAQVGEVISRVAAIAEAAFGKLAALAADTFGRAVTVVSEAVSQFLEFTGLGSVISGFADTVGAAFGGLWDTIKGIVGRVGGFIEQVLKFAEDWLGIVPEIEQPVVATIEVDGTGAIAELVKESKTLQTSLDSITKSVSDAINESAKFGQAGFDAALKYQTAIDDLKAKLDAGLFNEETFRREAEKAGAVFKQELAKIEEENKLELQINADVEKTLAGLQEQINKAAEGAKQFGQAGFDAASEFQAKLRDLGAQFDDGRINAATLAQEVAKATGEYDKQIEGFKKIDELQKQTLENEKNRVAELLKAGDTTTQLERDIELVERERLRLEEEIRKQREAGNVMAADAATARLAQLDQLQAKLDDQQQAVEQGFADGFTKAFEATNKSIDQSIAKAQQFGNVGALAFEALRAGVAKAQQQASDGILTAETYQKEVERQQELFNQRLAAAQRVEDFLANSIDDRTKRELEAAAKVEQRKKEAARNVEALESKLAEARRQNEQARADGDLKAARASATRLRELEQAQRIERNIADGRNGIAARQQQELRGTIDTSLTDFQSFVSRSNDLFQRGIRDTYAGANAALEQATRASEEQARKIEQLMTPGPRTVTVGDIRTTEGASLVTSLAAESQDPALIQARMQTKLLQQIASGIVGASQNYFNQPVAIVGEARLG